MEKDKNIENEIDWKIIDQLHNATNNFSKNCLEIKKTFICCDWNFHSLNYKFM